MADFALSHRSRISGTGSYLPEKRLTNAEIEKLVDTTDSWIVDRTGIRERRIAAPDEATSDLAYKASVRALEMAGITAQELDMIILATVSGDQTMPSTSCILQAKLGAKHVFALDISAACSGFVYGLSIADQYIKSGMYKNCLIVGSEVLSRLVNYKDRDTCILFGDGAGAAVLSRAPEITDSRIFSTHLHADGSLGNLLELQAGGSRMPISVEVIEQELHLMKMKGREIFKNAVRTLTDCSKEALETNKMTVSQLDWFIPHQANIRILHAVAEYFEIPLEKVIINLQNTGNTSAATIPIALDEAVRDGRVKRGQNLLMSAFGAGLTSGSALVRF
ncbi:MAG: ketoacyl-ACP synthase III [Bdellovibrionales bacterium]|nr:ketoacyl-ACP synthase III [Bdellovibrionales bacterium]